MMTREQDAKRSIEDYYRLDDDIQYYEEIIRTEAYDEDNPDEDSLYSLITQLENEKHYIYACWQSDYPDLDWDMLADDI